LPSQPSDLTPTAIRTVDLVCSRQALLTRLRLTTPIGIPVAAEITRIVAAYLTAERGLGRIAIDVDIDALAIILVGGAHLRATEKDNLLLDPADLQDVLKAGIGSGVTQPLHETRSA
jgi:hypothetical protein